MKRLLCHDTVKAPFIMDNKSVLSGAPYEFIPGKTTDVHDNDAEYLLEGNSAIFSLVDADLDKELAPAEPVHKPAPKKAAAKK